METSEEVVSDVFLKIWSQRKKLDHIENFQLYLYISAKNISLNYLWLEKRDHVFSIDDTKTEFTSFNFDPEQLLITKEMYKRIRAAMQQMSPRCRLIFKLVKEDNLTYKEVAELLDLFEKTVESQMTIALRKLGDSIYFREPSLLKK